MKIKVHTKILKYGFKVIKPLINKTPVVELSVKNKVLFMTGVDYDNGAYISYKLDNYHDYGEDDYGFIPIAGTQAICDDTSSEYLTIQTKEGAVKISGDNGFQRVLKLPTNYIESISSIQFVPDTKIPIQTPAQFRDSMIAVSPSLDKSINDVTEEITAISLSLQQLGLKIKDGTLELLGCSNNRISQAKFSIDSTINYESTIPFIAASHLVRLLKEAAEDTIFGFSEQHFFLQTPRVLYRASRNTYPFISIPPAFDKNLSIQIDIPFDKLKEAINLVGWGISGSDCLVFDIKKDAVVISSVTSLGEDGRFIIPIEYKGESIKLGLMKNLIKDVINNADVITLTCDSQENNVFFMAENNGVSFKHAISKMIL